MSKIKVAIVGVGSISGVHIKSYLALPDDFEMVIDEHWNIGRGWSEDKF